MRTASYIAFVVLMGLCSCRQTIDKESLRTVVVTHPETDGVIANGEISLPGVIKEGETLQVSFKIAGQIARLHVKEGDYVQKKQLIAVLDAADYQIALDASQAQYIQVKNEVERVKTLYERKSLSKNEYEKAIAGLDQVAADFQAKKNQVQYTRLYAPASGYVQRINARVGEMVNAGSAVVSLIDVNRMEVEVEIPYNIYQQRDSMNGLSAVLDGKKYPLTQLNIIPKAGRNQQYTMLLALPSNKLLKEASGLNVEVNFFVTDNKDAQSGMSIPESAIVYVGSQPHVWVLRPDSTLSKLPIKTGTMIGGKVYVLQGLEGTETIVKAGAAMLHDGEKVRVIEQKSATNPGGLL